MIEQDTIRLLRECDAGVEMGVHSLEDVLDEVENEQFRKRLKQSKEDHLALKKEVESLLHRCHDEGKTPGKMVKKMASMKAQLKMMGDDPDAAAAELVTDGCNIGIKSLNQYLNRYTAASEESKDIAKKLIHLEEKLETQIRDFL